MNYSKIVLQNQFGEVSENYLIPAGDTGSQSDMALNSGAFLNSGSGVPTSEAPLGSVYLRDDGSSIDQLLYVNTDGGTTWVAAVLSGGSGNVTATLLTALGAGTYDNVTAANTILEAFAILNLKANAFIDLGDGSDGNIDFSANTTLTRRFYYNNITIDPGVTLNPGATIMYVKGTLTLGSGSFINTLATAGASSATTAGGTGGTTTASPDFGAPGLGANGIVGSTGVGNAGGTAGGLTTDAGTLGGGAAGAGASSSTGVAGGAAVVGRAPTVIKIRNLAAITGNPVLIKGGVGGSGGSSGGGLTSNQSGGGGGGGAGAAVTVVLCNTLNNSGSIMSMGGNGGGGGTGLGTQAGGGGGGGGGSGGYCFVYFQNLVALGTISAPGGIGGAGGIGTGGNQGGNGSNGNAGTCIYYNGQTRTYTQVS